MGLFFYPRGGSARVAAYLSRALDASGWPVTLACGSIGEPGALGNAATVFTGVDIVPASYDEALARWRRGEIRWTRCFPCIRRSRRGRACPTARFRSSRRSRVNGWPRHGPRCWPASEALATARLLHLHHLTPLHDAAAIALPDVPVLTHLHGTELKMLDAMTGGEPQISGPYAELVDDQNAKRGASGDRHDRDLTA